MRKFTYSVIDKRKKIWLNYFEQYAKTQHEIQDEKSIDELDNNENNENNKSIYEPNNNNENDSHQINEDKQQLNEDKKFQNFFTGTKTRLAFLDLLLQHHFKDPKNFTIDDVKEEADTFMFAGNYYLLINY